MSDDTTPNLDLPFMIEAQADRETTFNEGMIRLDAVAQLSVVSRSVATPPGSPSAGQRWVIPAGASGAWAGRAHQIAAWYAGWKYFVPLPGWVGYAADENKLIRFKDGIWDLVSSGETMDSIGDVEAHAPADGDRLYFDAATSRWKNISGNLTSLKNVDASTPVDGDRLAWDALSSKWKNVSGRIRNLVDVDAPAPANGQVLTYDSSADKWRPATPAAGGTSGTIRTPPTIGMFTQVNTGTSAFINAADHLICEIEGQASGWITRLLARPAPSARYRITLEIEQPPVSTPYFGGGLFLRNSATNQHETQALQQRRDDSPNYMSTLSVFRWTSHTALSVLTERNMNTNSRIWIRVTLNDTSRITEVSRDGINWVWLHTVSASEFFTPDQVGIGFPTASILGHDLRCIYRIYHYSEEILP